MERADAILTAIQRIYQAVAEPDGWASVPPAIAAALGGQYALVLDQDATCRSSPLIASLGFEPAWYREAIMSDLAPEHMWTLPDGIVIRGSEVYSDREFEHLPFYNEVIRPIGGFYGMLANLVNSPQRRVQVSVGRALGADDFDDHDVAAMRTLVPHLASAMNLHRRLATANQAGADAAAALDLLDLGVIIVGQSQRPLFVNASARAAAASKDGLMIDREGVQAATPTESRALQAAIATALALADQTPSINAAPGGPGHPTLLLSRPSGRPSIQVVVMPLGAAASWPGPTTPRAAVFIVGKESKWVGRRFREHLQHTLGLTQAEVAVAVEIAKGDGRKAAAQRLGVSPGTVRVHLQRIFDKTGVHHQAELTRLVADIEFAIERLGLASRKSR